MPADRGEAEIAAVDPAALPEPDEPNDIASGVRDVLLGPVTAAKKAFLASLVQEVRVGYDSIQPAFRVPGTTLTLDEWAAGRSDASPVSDDGDGRDGDDGLTD